MFLCGEEFHPRPYFTADDEDIFLQDDDTADAAVAVATETHTAVEDDIFDLWFR